MEHKKRPGRLRDLEGKGSLDTERHPSRLDCRGPRLDRRDKYEDLLYRRDVQDEDILL